MYYCSLTACQPKENDKKTNCKTTHTTKYVGVYTGKQNCAVCVMYRDGNVLEHTKYKNTREAAGMLAKTLLSKYGKCSAVCKSISKMWMKTYEVFEEHHAFLVSRIKKPDCWSGMPAVALKARAFSGIILKTRVAR